MIIVNTIEDSENYTCLINSSDLKEIFKENPLV